MTRQSKAAKRKIVAATFTQLHKQGQKGPARTPATHGKVKTLKWIAEQKRLADLAKELQAAERAAANAKEKHADKAAPAKKTGYQGKNPRPQGKPAPKAAKQVATGTVAK